MNDPEREKWVNNDEGLYQWWQRSKLPIRQFVRTHRTEIDALIVNIQKGGRSMGKHIMLHIQTGNAAFVEAGEAHEVARILQVAAAKLLQSGSVNDIAGERLRDVNGNIVGQIKVVEIG